jgi:hypothetical protein
VNGFGRRINSVPTLDILEKRVSIRTTKTPHYTPRLDDRRVPTALEKMKSVTVENAMIHRHNLVLCVNESGAEAQSKIKQLFDRYG